MTFIAFIATIAAAIQFRELAAESIDAALATEIAKPTYRQTMLMKYVSTIYPAAIRDELDMTIIFVHAPEKRNIDRIVTAGVAAINTANRRFVNERAIHAVIFEYIDHIMGTRDNDTEWIGYSWECYLGDDACAAAEKAEVFAVLMASSKTLGIANPFNEPGFMNLATLMNVRMLDFHPEFGGAMRNAHILRLRELP